jgi:cytochrome c553
MFVYIYKISFFMLLVLLSSNAKSGDSEAGKIRYAKTCINCHGPAGKGVASYPKISGKEVSYITTMLKTYRDGIEVGPNSGLMIMMAKPLTDNEIADLAAYLKDAKYNSNKQ